MDVPERIGRYKILKEVGQGGMSVVYQATDVTLGREVAIKVLHPHLARRDDYQRRFQREARAVARLRHPNILEIYDYSGTESEQAYIVTQFIHGSTLRAFAEEHGPLLPEFTAMLGLKLAAALDHAHCMDVIHRDIKPENVMVSSNGTVVLMDFGLAQLRDTEQELTLTGTVMGSPAHMSPEHIMGKELDERADIFSLGTLLYLLCTGRFPFDAPNAQALFMKILDGNCEPAAMVRPQVGEKFSQIVATAMARNPEDRYQSAAELKRDLEHYLSELDMLPYEDQLRRFLDKPGPVTIETENILVTKLLTRSAEELAENQLIKTVSISNRLLAMRPDDPRVQGLLDSIRSFGTRRRLRKWSIIIGSLAIVSATAIISVYMLSQQAQREEISRRLHPGTQTTAHGTSSSDSATATATGTAPPTNNDQPHGTTTDLASAQLSGKPNSTLLTSPSPSTNHQLGAENIPGGPTPSTGPASGSATGTARTEPPSAASTTPGAKTTPAGSASGSRSTQGKQPSTTTSSTTSSTTTTTTSSPSRPQTGAETVWFEIRSYPYTSIWVDNKEIGTSTITKGVNLPVGKHEIVLRNPGCYPFKQTVTVKGDGTATPPRMTVRLRWLPAQLQVPGPAGAEVYLDNKPLGKTGADPFQVPMFGPMKKATIRIQRDVELLWSAEIQLRPGQTSTITP